MSNEVAGVDWAKLGIDDEGMFYFPCKERVPTVPNGAVDVRAIAVHQKKCAVCKA